ncbi:hypothetical protein AZSI13_04940 [Azospira sp. I13]|nr:hypothetical protein AZSI13_04940 [Azospira sp. I13]
MHTQTIHLHRQAPPKPIAGQPCNGCGVCCAAETCPLARLRFRQRLGPCPALEWQADAHLYRCGLARRPRHYWPGLPAWAEGLARRLTRRWIAAGSACDSQACIAL